MKKVLLFLVALTGMMLASCSKDDKLDDPKYKDEAALFTITDSRAAYQSIELTESGNYIIVPKTSYYNAPSRKSAFAGAKEAASRADYQGYFYGNYTTNGNGVYYLDGFGTMEVKSTGGTNVDLVITKDDGSEVALGARREEMKNSGGMTDKLCRTWEIVSVKAVAYINGKKVGEHTYGPDDIVDGDEMPGRVIFTRAGTYVCVFSDELAVAYWTWEDEKAGRARYSWDYSNMNDPDMSGTINISFDGNNMTVTESYEEHGHDGESYGETVTFRFKEVR